MSGVFNAIGKIAGVVSAVASVIPGGQAIAAIAAGVALVSNVGASLTAKKPPLLGSVSNITIGADQPTPMWIGDTYGGGALVAQNAFGAAINNVPNPYLAMTVIYSAGGPIAGFDQTYVDFGPLSFSGGGEALGYFSQILFHKQQLGATPEALALAAQWAGEPNWGGGYKLSGFAADKYSLKWDSKNGKYSSGAPQLGKRGRGVLTWDPRLDSTWPGGVGAHRWVDPRKNPAGFAAAKATWSYSFRSGLHALRYVLGTWERNPAAASDAPWILTYGVGMPVDGLVVEDFIELENVCEANDWEVSGELLEPGDKWANLKRILLAGGAVPCWKGGKLGLKITAPRIALDTITRDDLADGPLSAAGSQPRTERLNTVIPKFKSSDHKWQLQQSDEIVEPDFLALDGEEKRAEQVFEFVKRARQAAQLAAYAMFDSREQGPIELHCLPRLRRYAGGDMLALADEIRDDLGLEQNNVVVLHRSTDPTTMTVTLTLVTENLLKHIAAMAVTGTAPESLTLPTAEELDLNSGVADVLAQISALADDGVLTRFEKITKLIPLNTQLDAEYGLLDLQADALSAFPDVVSAQIAAADKFAAWETYRDALDPAWNDTGADTTIVRADFDTAINDLRYALDVLTARIREAVSTGAAAVTGMLTNDSHTVGADADGNVVGYAGAAGDFVVYSGTADVSSNFTLATKTGGNLKGLAVTYTGTHYAVTGGLDAGEPDATLAIVATGTGSYAGVTVEKVFSLGKSLAGEDGSPAALIRLEATYLAAKYNGSGTFVSGANSFDADLQNVPAGPGNQIAFKLIRVSDGAVLNEDTAAGFAATSPLNWSTTGPTNLTITAAGVEANLAAHGSFRIVAYSDNASVSDSATIQALRDGAAGIPGPPGSNGLTPYFYLAYADSADGTTNFTVGAPGGRTHIGVYTDFSPTGSVSPSAYTWSRYVGADGSNGTPGPPGPDGQTSYVHFAWANAADGSSSFSTTVSADKLYIGAYSDFTLADSTNPADYSWSPTKGDPGSTGAPGPPGSTGNPGYTISVTPTITINADYADVTKSGQLPKAIPAKFYFGTSDVTASVTAAITPSVGGLAMSWGSGSLSLTQADVEGSFDIVWSISGTPIGRTRFGVSRKRDNAPPASSTSVSGGFDGGSNPFGGSPAQFGSVLTISADGSGGIRLIAVLEYTSPTYGTNFGASGKACYRAAGSGGSWLDAGALESGSEAYYGPAAGGGGDDAYDGRLSLDQTVTGLTPGGAYEMTVFVKKGYGSGSGLTNGGTITVRQP